MEIANETNLDKKLINFIYEEEEKDSNDVHVYYKNTYVYGWGKNKYGELGLGNTENTAIP